MKHRGFIVHCYPDFRGDRLYLIGRLEDGRSFAAAEQNWKPSFHIYEKDRERAEKLLSSLRYEIVPPELEAFDGAGKLLELIFFRYRDYSAAGKLLENSRVPSPDRDLKLPEAFLVRRHIRGIVELEGASRPGRLVDTVFPGPAIRPSAERAVPLTIASVDIETDVSNGTILAIGISLARETGPSGDSAGGEGITLSGSAAFSARVLAPGPSPGDGIYFHPDEASLLRAFLEDIRKADPDVITGWNFLDFDYKCLAERFAFRHIPFTIGRAPEAAKFFPSSRTPDTARAGAGPEAAESVYSGGEARAFARSAAALVPGRQVLDALRIFRSGPRGWGARHDSGFTLEAVANSVLGEGKLVASSGGQKIAELEELYRKDPVKFGEYCRRDAELVLAILQKTGLWRLTMERSLLTGVALDKAWTSVASFERVYGTELHRRGIAPAPLDPGRAVSGAAGGTVLEPLPGLFNNVAVFDFRSLYPTIMLTFNIDPLAHARAERAGKDTVAAPNGALFSRGKGILPELVAEYFAARRRALDAGDEEASFVYKILMNSFYGVLGTPSCRYARTELAGAITSFAKKWLHFSEGWFTEKGYRVLYGDTDSLFVETGFPAETDYGTFTEWGKGRAGELNAALKKRVEDEYGLESFMELRFEKIYRRFLIPPLRGPGAFRHSREAAALPPGGEENRGRAKGYAGYLLNSGGGVSVEVKGMEAVRSDYTALARRVQLEFLELVFSGGGEAELKEKVNGVLKELRRGKLDGELVYRKRLARAPEAYTASTPPQVKAARALGWKNRRGTVEYVWTVNGPEPSAEEGRPLSHSRLDYDHYADTQVLPTARSIAAAAGWSRELFASPGPDFFKDGQMELGL